MNNKILKITTIITTILSILIIAIIAPVSFSSFELFPNTYSITDFLEELFYGIIIFGFIPLLFLIKYIRATTKKEKYFEITVISKCVLFLNITIMIISLIDILYYVFITSSILGAFTSSFMLLALIPFEIAYIAALIWLCKLKKEKTKYTKLMKLEVINGFLPLIMYIILMCTDSDNYGSGIIFFILLLPIIFVISDFKKIVYNRKYNILLIILNIILLILCIATLG